MAGAGGTCGLGIEWDGIGGGGPDAKWKAKFGFIGVAF